MWIWIYSEQFKSLISSFTPCLIWTWKNFKCLLKFYVDSLLKITHSECIHAEFDRNDYSKIIMNHDFETRSTTFQSQFCDCLNNTVANSKRTFYPWEITENGLEIFRTIFYLNSTVVWKDFGWLNYFKMKDEDVPWSTHITCNFTIVAKSNSNIRHIRNDDVSHPIQ